VIIDPDLNGRQTGGLSECVSDQVSKRLSGFADGPSFFRVWIQRGVNATKPRHQSPAKAGSGGVGH